MLAYLFVIFAVVFRLVPRPTELMGFAPVGAALLYFGARAPRKHIWFPLLALAASDLFLTRSTYAYPFSLDHLVTWAWYAAMLLLGGTLARRTKPLYVAGAGLASAVSFFVVSNFAVWITWNMYPKTLAGLTACYAAAVPFFRNGIAGDLFFTAVMFGIGALVASREAGEKRVVV
jgi:hypothetical protein